MLFLVSDVVVVVVDDVVAGAGAAATVVVVVDDDDGSLDIFVLFLNVIQLLTLDILLDFGGMYGCLLLSFCVVSQASQVRYDGGRSMHRSTDDVDGDEWKKKLRSRNTNDFLEILCY